METMLQYFEWYLPEDGQLWNQLKKAAPDLKEAGFTKIWMPPAYKGQAGGSDIGYGVYDMYDLGEFNAKGSVATKYGTKQEYVAAVQALKENGIDAVGDIVFNHRMGSDKTETISATTMNWTDRNQPVSDQHDVEVWTKYTFPERKGKYSKFTWNWNDFTGTDFDQKNGDKGLLKFEGKEWNPNVSREQGNFDFIMGDDVDFREPEVIRELYRWGRWYVKTAGINAFRLDAVKSIDSKFFPGWLHNVQKNLGHPCYAVGEYWSGDVRHLEKYLDDCDHCMALFDVPLHFHLKEVAESNGTYDLRSLWKNTLTDSQPEYACAFVDNHDTQPTQALESWVQDWFKPQAYAIILLRSQPCPCVFYGDLYGIPHDNKQPVPWLWDMVWICRNLLSNTLTDYETNDPQMMAWLVRGEHPIFVILTEADWKEYNLKEPELAGKTFLDITDPGHKVTLNDQGEGRFTCRPRSLGIYVTEEDWANRGDGQLLTVESEEKKKQEKPAEKPEPVPEPEPNPIPEKEPEPENREQFILREPSLAKKTFVDITSPDRKVTVDENGEASFVRGDGPAGIFVLEEEWNGRKD